MRVAGRLLLQAGKVVLCQLEVYKYKKNYKSSIMTITNIVIRALQL